MMRGPSYDDNYLSRKLYAMQSTPTFVPPSRAPVGGYLQPLWDWRRRGYHRMYFRPGARTEVWYVPSASSRLRFLRDWRSSTPYLRYLDDSSLDALESSSSSTMTTSVRPLYAPSARTQLILNRVALAKPRTLVGPPPRMTPSRYSPLPTYYDYDYGGYGGYPSYGGYGGYGYGPYLPPPLPRYRSYDPYLDDDYDLNYVPRYRSTRYADALLDLEKDRLRRSLSPARVTTSSDTTNIITTTIPKTDFLAKHFSPGLGGEGDDGLLTSRKPRTHTRLRAIEGPSSKVTATDGDRPVTRTPHRYQALSEPQMLQDQVDKMRIKLKSMAFSLDPTGPVPEIVIPEHSRRVDSQDYQKKYSSGPRHLACVEYAGQSPQWKRRARARYPSEDPNRLSETYRDEVEEAEKNAALEMTELPRLSSRRHRYYPEDEYMKDNLRIKCLSHYKTTRTQADKDPEKLVLKDRLSIKIHNYFSDALSPDQFQQYLKSYRAPGPKPIKYWKPKGYYGDQVADSLPNYTSRYASAKIGGAKWEEPDTVYGSATEKKPYSKVETGSSFFSTYGYTNRMKDTVAEKVRDYYYYGDENKSHGSNVRFSERTYGKTSEAEDDDSKKERRKKKSSKERDEIAAIDLPVTNEVFATSAAAEMPVSVPEPAAPAPSSTTEEQVSAAPKPATTAAAAVEPESEMDEKERKRLEKKKRKAEREAAAKAAMEAELAALAAAEAELARLEAESASLKSDTTSADVKGSEAKASEKPAGKCESPVEPKYEVLPELPQKELECEPPSLYPETAVDESLQGVVEKQPNQDEVIQDLSAEKVTFDEPVISVWPRDDHQFIEEAWEAPESAPTQVEQPEPEPVIEEPEELPEEIKTEEHVKADEVPQSYEEPIEVVDSTAAVGGDEYQQIGAEAPVAEPPREEGEGPPEKKQPEEIPVDEGEAAYSETPPAAAPTDEALEEFFFPEDAD